MKDYIERASVHSIIERTSTFAFTRGGMHEKVDSLPAADVAEVRHGRWIGIEYDGYADGYPVYDLWECSECGEEVRGEDIPSTHPWCHSCGARMDKEDEHGTD